VFLEEFGKNVARIGSTVLKKGYLNTNTSVWKWKCEFGKNVARIGTYYCNKKTFRII
jgi:hypothetical protein